MPHFNPTTTSTDETSTSSYSEMKIDGTLYRVTSFYLGQKDLKTTLEQLAVKRIYDEISNAKPLNPNG